MPNRTCSPGCDGGAAFCSREATGGAFGASAVAGFAIRTGSAGAPAVAGLAGLGREGLAAGRVLAAEVAGFFAFVGVVCALSVTGTENAQTVRA